MNIDNQLSTTSREEADVIIALLEETVEQNIMRDGCGDRIRLRFFSYTSHDAFYFTNESAIARRSARS